MPDSVLFLSEAMMRLMVTGGAGFIGSHITEQALALGWTVAVLDDLSSGRRGNVPAAATFFQVDIRDRAAVMAAFEAFHPQVVAHQAAQASVAVSVRDPVRDAEINIIGGLNLLDAAVATKIERFLFASTGGAIYGEVPCGSATEETPPLPLSPYAASKFAFENYLRCYHREHGLQSNVLRYANVYGPRQDPHGEAGVVAIFIQRLLAHEPIQINAMRDIGDPGCIRDYVHVYDVARANIAAAQGKVSHNVLNIGTGVETTTQHLANVLKQLTASNSDFRPGPRRAGDTERSVLSAARFEALFGPTRSLHDGLLDTLTWFRNSRSS